jgi:flagellar assembly factor FliW
MRGSMKINTEKFGDIEFEENAIINFSEGILGFPENKKYILLNADEGSPFKWLQSLEDMGLTFLLIDPFTFKPDYKVELSESVKEELGGIKSKEDYVVFVIVVIHKDPAESTANLLGPIILNIKNQQAKQIVLSDFNYTTKCQLLGG